MTKPRDEIRTKALGYLRSAKVRIHYVDEDRGRPALVTAEVQGYTGRHRITFDGTVDPHAAWECEPCKHSGICPHVYAVRLAVDPIGLARDLDRVTARFDPLA